MHLYQAVNGSTIIQGSVASSAGSLSLPAYKGRRARLLLRVHVLIQHGTHLAQDLPKGGMLHVGVDGGEQLALCACQACMAAT